MMSPESIRNMSDDAARSAARTKKIPYVVFDSAEIDRMPPFPFPFLGSYVPKGWKLVESLFCDSSGFGTDHEPAMSIRQLQVKLREHIASTKAYGYAITEVGQFQCYVGVYEKTATRRSKRVPS